MERHSMTNGNGDAARAAALVEFRMMQEEIDQLRADKIKLERDLQTADDRMVLVLDERNRFRKEANLYQAGLLELSTSMQDIGLLTEKAVKVREMVMAMMDKVTGRDDEEETT